MRNCRGIEEAVAAQQIGLQNLLGGLRCIICNQGHRRLSSDIVGTGHCYFGKSSTCSLMTTVLSRSKDQ